MIDGINNNLDISRIAPGGATGGRSVAGSSGAASFADTLKASIDEVARLQQDASQAVQDLATGRTEDMAGVMSAVQKSDVAFKMLLAIRSKLMEAYEEIKNMQV